MGHDDIEDAAQQVRLKLLEWDAQPGRAPILNHGAWAAVAASHLAVDWHRSRSRETSLLTRLSSKWRSDPGEVTEDDRALALTVADSLDRLNVQHRQVVILRYYAELSVRDIATTLSIPEGTVKSRLHHGLRQLRDALSSKEGDSR